MKISRLLLAFCLCLPVAAKAQLSDDALQCFEWFSTLGYPEVKDAPWAEIWTGSYHTTGGSDDPVVQTQHGFITAETGTEFTVLRLDLTQGTLQKSKPGTPAHMRVGFEKRPLGKMIDQQLELLRNPPKEGFRRFDIKLGHKAEVFFLAHGCWQRGEIEVAAQLYEEAQKLPHLHAGDRKAASMRESLQIDLGHAAMWDAVLRCGGGRLGRGDWGRSQEKLEPRPALLEAFRRVVRLFPRCAHIERAKDSIAMLERMVEEDKKHVSLSQEQINKLPQDQRIAELIWLLRDQNGHQWGQPGWCDVFSLAEVFSPEKIMGTSPAHQLLAIGDAAAPALIEALTDDRFSRSVGFHRDFHFSHTILTVGDCAQQILSRMTGQNFYSPGSTSGYMSNEQKMRDVQKAAQAWWKEYQQKGKKQMLADSIAAGRTSPGPLVRQLQKEAPAAVADAVLRGADNAQSDGLARQFITELAALKGPEGEQRLVKFMKSHPQLEVRLAAAGRLLNADHAEALPAVLHEWCVFPAADHHGLRDGFEEMVELLLASGDVQAMKKLVAGWEARPVYERFEIVHKMGGWLGGPAKEHSFSGVKARAPSAEARTAAVALLARALEDTVTRDGMSGGIGEFEYSSPRICDFALWALHEIDGKKYVFSPRADRRQREAERTTAANVWRKEHGQPLLPPPPHPGPKLNAKDALKIVRVSVDPQEGFAETALVRRALALQGGVFGPKTLASLLLEFAQQPVQGASGLRVEAVRGSDLTGVELQVRLTRGQYPAGKGQSWQTMHNGQIGKNRLGSSGGSASLSHLTQEDCWDDFEEEIQQSLKALPPDADFTLSAGLQAGR